MKCDLDWHGQNIPPPAKPHDGFVFHPLPVLEKLLHYNEDRAADEFLPSPTSYGWNDNSMNQMAWAHNFDNVLAFELDMRRYGCLPAWFPRTDAKKRPLTPQGQVDRFLYILDSIYGGLPEDHTQVPVNGLAQALLEMYESEGGYWNVQDEEMEWQLAESQS